MTTCDCGAEPSEQDFGIEIQGKYDGVLIWQCAGCGSYRPRFDGPGRLYSVALEVIERWGRHERDDG